MIKEAKTKKKQKKGEIRFYHVHSVDPANLRVVLLSETQRTHKQVVRTRYYCIRSSLVGVQSQQSLTSVQITNHKPKLTIQVSLHNGECWRRGLPNILKKLSQNVPYDAV